MRILKKLTVFTFGGLAYGILEIIWRGETHISMFLVGGLCFLMISLIDADLPGGSILLKAPLCAAAVTATELVSGVIINIVMKLDVWDYSSLPFNLWGQICLPFSAMWLGLSAPAAIVGRLLKYLVFDEELPELRLLHRRAVAAEEQG